MFVIEWYTEIAIPSPIKSPILILLAKNIAVLFISMNTQ